eukprot:Skav235711  [mRNA]  locus=scaffold280:474141:480364:- [translate_table: standard]
MPSDSLLTKRFPVRQKNKIRPIDDYKANMVNQSVTQTEGVSTHTIDHIASMVACWLKASSGQTGRSKLVAKCWDLSDAYKQILLSDEAYQRDAFLAVFCPSSGKAEVFRQKVLPFGSIASVTAFLRVSLALWAVGNVKLKFAGSAYFDDFLSVCEEASAKRSDLCISAMFSFLGWRLSEDKLIPFDSVCKALGVRLDFESAKLGVALVSNTPERIKELVEELDKVLKENKLARKDGERLRGRLQFANSQLFGRALRKHLKELSNHVSSGRKVLSKATQEALSQLSKALTQNKPRSELHRLTSKKEDTVNLLAEQVEAHSFAIYIIDNKGEIADFYDVEDTQIGEGSFGRVCKCTNKSTGAERAVKMLRKVRRKSQLTMFKNELSTLKMPAAQVFGV